MAATSVKYFFIVLCCFYIFTRLLRIQPQRRMYFQSLLFSLVMAFVIYFLRVNAPPLSIIITTGLFIWYVKYLFNMPINTCVTASIISFGISYLAFWISALIMLPVGFVAVTADIKGFVQFFSVVLIGVLQFLICVIPFKLRRFKNGMPFLKEFGSSEVGVYISVSLLIAASFFDVNKEADIVYVIPFFFVFISGLTLVFWWRNRIAKNYIEKVKAKEIEALQNTIQEKDAEIEKLKYHNDELAKIIHRDNKLIPAMAFSVREFLLSAEQEEERKALPQKGKALLEQLEQQTRERTGIVKSYEFRAKRLPLTYVPSIDGILSYMLQKAKEHQIEMDLSLSGSVKYLTENFITEMDLKTLLADLIENAIIASKRREKKNIMVHMGIEDKCYLVEVFDSGVPFTLETLSLMGLKRTTTHADEGGSGIGIMTLFEILQKTRASLVIEEFTGHSLFTKKVSLCFDGLGQYRIKTDRADEIRLLSKREELLVEFTG